MKINCDFEFQIRIALLGDSGVGKTNFIFQFIEGKFSKIYVTTIGFDNKSKIVKLPKSKKNIKVNFFDTAGQERYMALNKNLFHKVQGIILMYDLTNRESFENIEKWLNMLEQTVSNKEIILVANKLDIADEMRIVDKEEGENFAKKHNMLFFESSGCSGQNVEKIITNFAEKIYTELIKRDDSVTNSVELRRKKHKKKKKNCC